MTDRRAAILTLGRAQGMGEIRRVESWQRILEAAGFSYRVVRLRSEFASTRHTPPDLRAVIRGAAPPETLSWSPKSARNWLATADPYLTVFVTLRAFHPRLLDVAGFGIVDLVDCLSRSYRDRAKLVSSRLSRIGFATLSRSMVRAERHPHSEVIRVAAGRSDAELLNAHWVPNVIDPPPPDPNWAPDHDLVFFGNLAYPPNVAAVELLGSWWPAVQRERPATTLLITGRSPSARVLDAAAAMGATLEVDFADPFVAARRGRLAVAPLVHAAGIQNKVIEAAAAGVPQVLTSPAAAGLPPSFPAGVADDPTSFGRSIRHLLDNPSAAIEMARAARAEVSSTFTSAPWARWLLDVMQDDR